MLRLRSLLLAAGLLAPGLSAQDLDDPAELAAAVRPLLADRCFACHGFDAKARKVELRLDTLAGQRTPREKATPVVPGDPGASELIRRIESTDPKVQMPPPDSGRRLDASEKALLRRWVAVGAPLLDHWAFVAPRPVAEPEVRAVGWPRNGIDRFVLARLEAAGLRPAPEADRETLIRRVTLDLSGLPPAPERIDAFLADDRPDAYERLVDELFASEHYGERMAQLWLDVARYADTNGYHHDNIRTSWPYRDWVIGAFQDDLPYDRFVTEQLAGDLLPDATESQRIASGFCRMHNINDEGGAIDAEYRVEAIADRIETISTAIMGLTFTCARCHDHKYDPFTQEDYYSLYAIFGSIDERGVYPNSFEPARAYPPRLMYAPNGLKERIARIDAELAAVKAGITAIEPEVARELSAWEAGLRDAVGIAWVAAELAGATTRGDTPVERLEDGSVRLSGRPDRESIELRLLTDATDLRMLRLEVLADPSFVDGRVGLSNNGNAVITSIAVEARSVIDPAQKETVAFVWAWADHEQANGDFDVLNAIRGSGDGWALGGHDRPGDRTALLFARHPFGFAGGSDLRVTVTCDSRYDGHVTGRVRASFARAAEAVVRELPMVPSDWWLAGPFPGSDFEVVWDRAFGPEGVARIDRDQNFGKVGWKHRPDDDAKTVALSGERSAFYFARELRTPNAMRLPISLGSDDAIRVFLDGEEVLANKAMRGVAPDQERVVLELGPGEHLLVVKVVNNGGPGGFYGRLDPASDAPEPLRPWALVPPDLREPAISAGLIRAFGSRSSTWAGLEKRRIQLEAEHAAAEAERVPVLVMAELPEPRPTYVLNRGRYDMVDLARPVDRRPPVALGGAFPDGVTHDRLGFAQWLTQRDHPLTARVHVNRIWQMVFGTGIVASVENFGQQADAPSHPRLLDWLALRFVDEGWSQRALLRSIVTSATYRQAARIDPAAHAVDPGNRLLASFPRRRLAGEFVRDLALAASGLLVGEVGGPSVRPYQPDGLWREVSIGSSSNTQVFERDDGDALWRRSLYTFWKRTSPNPQMSTFDVPPRESCVVRRSITNTPLQALILWNDEQFVEAARALAQRTMRAVEGDDARLVHMFRLCTGRRPAERELQVLGSTLAWFRARYQDDESAATALVTRGASMVDDSLDARETAAFTMLGSTMLSLDETIVRD